MRRLKSPRTGVELQANPRESSGSIPLNLLTNKLFAPSSSPGTHDQRFGRQVSLTRIEYVIQMARSGSMREIADLLRETVEMDPHLGSVLNKRFRSISSLPWEVYPASGVGIDKERALFYAEVVRAQLRQLASFRENLNQLAWALFDGRACHEILWSELLPGSTLSSPKFGEATYAVSELAWIHPRRLSFGAQRELRVTTDAGAAGFDRGVDVRAIPDKFIWWLPQLFGDYPEREGLGIRALYWSFFKRFAQRERMILTEIFGKPWRIVEVDENSTASHDELLQADRIADSLGASYTARMPRGTRLNVVAPSSGAGATHSEVIRESDAQISKLVLGQTGTTDGVPSGLNSNQSGVMQDEQLGVLTADAMSISELIETMLTDRIIAVNFGEMAVSHAPKFRLRADLPADRNVELARLKAAVESGLEVALSEAYEVSGFSVPDADQPIVKMVQPPTPPNAPVAPAVRPGIVYPVGSAPTPGELVSAETEASMVGGTYSSAGAGESAATVTVNEDRAARGLPPLALFDGTPDPRGAMTIYEFKSLFAQAAGTGQFVGAPAGESPAGDSALDIVSDEDLDTEPATTVTDEDLDTAPTSVDVEEAAALALDDLLASFDHADAIVLLNASTELLALLREDSACYGDQCGDPAHVHLALADVGFERTANGSVDDLNKPGIAEMTRAAQEYAKAFTSEIGDETRPSFLLRALRKARENMDVGKIGRALERSMLRATMLGILDSSDLLEFDATDQTELANDWRAAHRLKLATAREFTRMTMTEALRHFRSLKPIDRPTFERLQAAIKRKSFTIAGQFTDRMLIVAQDELAKSAITGSRLRFFSQDLQARLAEHGFVPGVLKNGQKQLGASHTENVFRTNTLNTYNSGRYAHQTSPSVIAKFPVWEMRAIRDPRSRETHARVHGVKLLASDPFWRSAYPPYGFMCRCRVIPRPASYLSQVVPGSSISGLPDNGFTSGLPALTLT